MTFSVVDVRSRPKDWSSFDCLSAPLAACPAQYALWPGLGDTELATKLAKGTMIN
jgi:hypothetical protein